MSPVPFLLKIIWETQIRCVNEKCFEEQTIANWRQTTWTWLRGPKKREILPFHNIWNAMHISMTGVCVWLCVCACMCLYWFIRGVFRRPAGLWRGLWCNEEFTDRHCPLTVKCWKGDGLNLEEKRSSCVGISLSPVSMWARSREKTAWGLK